MKPLLALIGIATMAGSAPLARAIPDDPTFLSTLDAAGITYHDPGQAVAAAKTLCQLVARGESGTQVLGDLTANNPGFTSDGAAEFAAIAAQSYCPEKLARSRS